jgi:hypothetical protein
MTFEKEIRDIVSDLHRQWNKSHQLLEQMIRHEIDARNTSNRNTIQIIDEVTSPLLLISATDS